MNNPIHPISVSGGQGVQVGDGNTQHNYYSITLSQHAEEGENLLGVVEDLAAPATSKPGRLWNIPYPPNPFFTGREDILKQLEQALLSTQKVALTQIQTNNQQVISGLGGIGKTQTAIEYAYRHREQYRAVLWAQADNPITLDIEFGRIATLLDLPEKNDQDTAVVRNAVKRWLAGEENYLFILDNADNPEILTAFLPSQLGGHLLLTSRARSFGKINLFNSIQLPVLILEEAKTFLLRRTGHVDPGAPERQWAAELAQELGCLPLALEQAGAYIVEKQVRFDDYLASFRRRKIDLLEKQGPETGGYDKRVATTWSLNFEAVEQESRAAAEVLRVSAFLGPDRIPEELLITSEFALEDAVTVDPLLIAELIAPLTRYSLIQRDSQAHTYDIHRLVQEVIQYRMDERTHRVYADMAVVLVSSSFRRANHLIWQSRERLLPHALVCANHIIALQIASFQAATLLSVAGRWMTDRAQYAEAEPLAVLGLAICRQVAEPDRVAELDHLDIASSLNILASIYNHQGRYEEAEPLFKEALSLDEKTSESENSALPRTLNNLGSFYRMLGRIGEAEPLLVRAVAISEERWGAENHVIATYLNSLAGLYKDQGRYDEAKPLYERSLALRRNYHGLDHPATARGINNLGVLYYHQCDYEQAKPLLVQALAIRETILGLENPETATSLHNIGNLHVCQGDYKQAEQLYKQVLAVREKKLGSSHRDTAGVLSDFGVLRIKQGRYKQAELLLARALAIYEKVLNPQHNLVINTRREYMMLLDKINMPYKRQKS